MALVSHEDKAHRHPGIAHAHRTTLALHSPSPHLQTLRVPPTPGLWDPCSTEALEVPDPKTNRIWGESEALGGKVLGCSHGGSSALQRLFAHHKPSLVHVLFASASFQPLWSPPFCSSSFPAHHPWTGPLPTSLWSSSNPH